MHRAVGERFREDLSLFSFGCAAVLWLASWLVGVAGCGPKNAVSNPGTVSGIVTIKGTPVTNGQVWVAPAANAPPRIGVITANGSFSVQNVAAGNHKVWLASGGPIPGMPDKAFDSVPKEFMSFETTPLTVTVQEGGTADFPIAIGK